MASEYWKIRATLENWLVEKKYGNVTIDNGETWLFLPTNIGFNEKVDGSIVWYALGVCWNYGLKKDEIAWLTFSLIENLEESEFQPK